MEYGIIDESNDFASLSNSIGRFKANLCKELGLEFKSQDFRLVFLDSIQQQLLSLTSYIRAFVELQQRVSSPDEFLKILNIGIFTVEEYEDSRIIYKFPIESLVTMVHFQIDSLFGDICSKAETPHTGFYKRMKCVLDSTGIESAKKDEFHNTLQCLAFFRNTFHSAGLHTINRKKWKDGVEPAKGVLDRAFTRTRWKIEFKHKELAVYNWKSAFLLIQESVKVMQSLIMTIYTTK